MRIIAGQKRGMKLLSPIGNRISRPVTDRVKESLFSMLYKYGLPESKRIADLFAGVGSMGLESLSRGAKTAIFVEKNTEVLAKLKKNITKAGFNDTSKVICADVFRIGAGIVDDLDVIFVDPPFAATRDVSDGSALAGLMEKLCDQLNEKGLVVLRTHKQVMPFDKYGRLIAIDRRVWGINSITIFQLADNE